MDDPEFCSGSYDIGYLDRKGGRLLARYLADDDAITVAVAVALAEEEAREARVGFNGSPGASSDDSGWLHDARRRALR
jgi:hypothetical protein